MQIHPSHQPEARRALRTVALGVLVLLLTYQPRLIIPMSMAGPALALSAFWL